MCNTGFPSCQIKNLCAMQETWVQSLDWEDPGRRSGWRRARFPIPVFLPGEFHQQMEMTTHSSVLAWEIPWTEEPGGLQSMGLHRVGHDLVTKQHNLLIYSIDFPICALKCKVISSLPHYAILWKYTDFLVCFPKMKYTFVWLSRVHLISKIIFSKIVFKQFIKKQHALLCTWKYHNTINQLSSNIKEKVKKNNTKWRIRMSFKNVSKSIFALQTGDFSSSKFKAV